MERSRELFIIVLFPALIRSLPLTHFGFKVKRWDKLTFQIINDKAFQLSKLRQNKDGIKRFLRDAIVFNCHPKDKFDCRLEIFLTSLKFLTGIDSSQHNILTQVIKNIHICETSAKKNHRIHLQTINKPFVHVHWKYFSKQISVPSKYKIESNPYTKRIGIVKSFQLFLPLFARSGMLSQSIKN